jgi:DNA-directed RNA polymerase subunit M/transcription elongation factor TFIIS
MLPKKEGNKMVLVCRSCGYEMKRFKGDKYKIVVANQRGQDDIAIVEMRTKKDADAERKYNRELYGDGVGDLTDF